MTYSEKLKHPKWQKKRLEILQRDKFMCQNCGDEESNLQVHHTKYVYGKEIWDYHNDSLITFCSNCHSIVSEKKKYIKNCIDENFTHPDYLNELSDILDTLCFSNPCDLMNVRKLIEKYNDKKLKRILKNG